MGIWENLFGKNKAIKPVKSPFLPPKEEPVDIEFAKNFTQKGGRFLYIDSELRLHQNYQDIGVENAWESEQILTLNPEFSTQFGSTFIEQTSGNLKAYKAAVIGCEYLISNTAKILLSQNQIKHFKLTDLPETVIVVAHVNQLVRDVSQGMTLLKNKYDKAIPTNITTLKIKSDSGEEKSTPELYTSAKNIYLLLQDF